MTGPTRRGWPAAFRCGVLLVTAAAVVGFGATGAAQEEEQAEPPPQQQKQQRPQPRFEDEISVTGSLIPRPTLEAMSPVTVMEPSDITHTGITRLEDLLTTLPQVFRAQNSTISNGATGTATVDLRYLGHVRTLVLINGRRMPTGDVGSPVADLNFIPAGLVKRIDVLTGGASSVYGADAVAGVVNFILDTDLEGFRGGVEYGAYQHDNRNELMRRINTEAGFTYPTGSTWDGEVVSAYAALGGKFANGKGHATVYLDYRHIDAITMAMRDYANCFVSRGPNGPVCGGSAYTPAGVFISSNQDYSDYRLYARDPSNDDMVPYTGQVYNYSPLNYMQRPDRRWAAGAFIHYAFNPHVEGYAEVMFMDDFTDAQIAPSADFGSTYLINCDNPMLTDQQRELFCTQWGYGPHDDANVQVLRRSVESGPRYDSLRHTAWRLLGGARGSIDGQWSYDIYGLHAEVQIPESYHNDLNVDRLQDALLVVGDPADPSTWRCRSGNEGCVPWNIFSAGGVTQAAVDYIRTAALSQGSTETEMVEGKLVGDLEGYGWKLPAASEGIQVALGALYRKEGLVLDPDEVERTGNAAGFGGPVPPVSGSYNVTEAYVEARVPLIQDTSGAQDLSLELGYRYSDYNLSGSHPTYKAQLSYAPVVGLKLRAGLARAVRAPNINELFTPQERGLGGSEDICANDPATGVPSATLEECVRTGVTPAQYGHILANPAGQYNVLYGGNPELEPETADTHTLGFVVTPPGAPGLSAAVDYYDIRVGDTIWPLFANDIITTCARTGDPALCSLIHRDASGSLWLTPDGYTITTDRNIGGLATRGVDVNASYLLHLGGAGFLNMNLVGSYLISNRLDNALRAYDCAGYFGGQCGLPLPRWRHRAVFSWETTFRTVFSLGWRYMGPVTNDDASPDPDLANPDLIESWKINGAYELDAVSYFDLSVTYDFTKGVQLTVGVDNILDKEPPLAPSLSLTGFIGTYDPWGRFVHASMLFTF